MPPPPSQWGPPLAPQPGWPAAQPSRPGPGEGTWGGRPAARAGNDIPNYLVWAVLSAVFFFTPAGVVGIIFALIAKRRASCGDIDGGQRASRIAKASCWVSVIVGLVIYLLMAARVIPSPRFS